MSSNHDGAARKPRPSTGVEQQVVDAWSDVLGVEDLNADSDFFALGGDSYQVVQVITLLEGTLGIEVPVRFLFQQPTTVAGLARRIEVMRWHMVPGDGAGADGSEVGEL